MALGLEFGGVTNRSQAGGIIIAGVAIYAFIFAVNSTVHSFLILKFTNKVNHQS